MAKGYSIFDKLPRSPISMAETILSPTTAALSKESITSREREAPPPTGFGAEVDPKLAKDFPTMTVLGGYGPEGFEGPPALGSKGRYLSPEPALSMDPKDVTIKRGEPVLGSQAIISRQRKILDRSKLDNIISVKDSNLTDDDLMRADFFITKRLLPNGKNEKYSFRQFIEGEDTLEARQKLVDENQGMSLGYTVKGKTRDITNLVPIPYMSAVFDEKYENILKDIDKKLVGIPFVSDEARSRFMVNLGYDEDTNRAIFAKQFDNFLIAQGVKSQRTRAGIILHSVNLPHVGGVGFSDPSKLVGIFNETTVKFPIMGAAYLLGEAFGAISEDLGVGGYNLTDSADREAWLSTFIPNMPSLIQDRYTQLNLDVPYTIAEKIARRFSGAGTQTAAIATEVAGATKIATLKKLQGGKKEMEYFADFEARYRRKYPDAGAYDEQDVIVAFEKMRKNSLNIYGNYRLSVDLSKAKDIKLIGGVLNIPAKAFAFVNGLRTSSRFKTGMELTDAAQAASNRIEVRNMAQYYRGLHNQKNGILERARQANRGLTADEARRLEEVTRKIEITKTDLRKTVSKSETPKFIREANVMDASIIIGSATANQAFEIYGGDPMLGEFLGALGGIAYGLMRGGKDAKNLLKKFDLENVTDRQLDIAELVLNNMKNFDPEFQEALRTRVKYFNGLKKELESVGVNPEVLDRSVSRILGLSLLQTLEEGTAMNLSGPQVAGFNAQTQALHKNLLTQQKFVSELRTAMRQLSTTEGVDIEGNPVKKLYDTIEAAVTYADGTTAQLADDLKVIGRSYQDSVEGMIRGADPIYDHHADGTATELKSALDNLTEHNIKSLTTKDAQSVRNEIKRTHTSIAKALKEKAKQIGRVLPTQGDVNKQVGKVLPDGRIIRPGKEKIKPRDIQTAGDAMAALLESRNVRERELAASPFRELDGAIFRTADNKPIVGEATTDAGPVLDSIFEALGTEDGTVLLLEMSGKTLSRSTSGKMFAFLDEAAGGFILDVAERQGRSVDDIIENTLTAAAQANDPTTMKLLKDKRIPPNLMVAQLLRNELQLAGENIGVLPISFKQAKEMADAMNQIGFKTQNQTAKLKIDNIQNIAEGLMESFEVQLETGQRVSVGQLFVEQADGSLRSTQEILNEGKARWTEYKRRFYDDKTISTWLGWRDKKARQSVGVSSEYPLGIDYNENAPINWLDFNKISNMNPDERTKFSRSLQETLGLPDANGKNYRIRVDTEEGQAAGMILEARTREWLTQTILSDEPIDFNKLRRQMRKIQNTFTGVTEDGKQVNLINLDRVMTDVFPEFGKNSVDPQYFELGVKKLKKFAEGEADRIVREATVIKKGIEDSSNFLRRFSRGELDSRSVGTTLISGGVGRLQDLKKHLKSLGRNEQETNDIIRSLLVQEMDNKAFRATGQYSIDPTNPSVMIPNVDLNIEALKDFMGYADKSQEAVVREIIGDKQYDTYKAIINFTANEVVDSAGRTNITGIPRQFSVESYISRFYAVNRGVVSFRYVGTEAILQQMRQKNMSLLTVALTDPKIGGLLMEMVDTGKPLPFDKDRQLFEALVVASERFDNWRETSKDPIKVSSDYGHEFIYMNGKSLYEQVVGKPK